MRSRLGKALREEQPAPTAPSPQPGAALLASTQSKTPLPLWLWGQDLALPPKTSGMAGYNASNIPLWGSDAPRCGHRAQRPSPEVGDTQKHLAWSIISRLHR